MRMSEDNQLGDTPMVSVLDQCKRKQKQRHVSFGSVRVIEFCVGYSSCAVPSNGGPPVGLIGKPINISEHDLGNDPTVIEEEDCAPRSNANDVWICPVERVRVLQEECGFQLDEITIMCREVRAVTDSRTVARLDFDTSYALSSGDISRLKTLCDVRYASQPQVPRQKVVLFEMPLMPLAV